MNKKITLAIPALLDPDFQPAALCNRNYVGYVIASGNGVLLIIGLERERGLISCFEAIVHLNADAATLRYIERNVKFLLWAVGGWKVYVGGPKGIDEHLRTIYSDRGARKSDCQMMEVVYAKTFQAIVTTPAKVPRANEIQILAGGQLQDCRIGFDLGASDYKVSAVVNGEAIFTEEAPWDSKNTPNPEYHYHHLSAALHRAVAHLPRVDTIGGSSAGIVVDNEIRVASLLRSVPNRDYPRAARIFKCIQKEWNVPLVVMNSGDATALADALSPRKQWMLGIAMGSSEAAGFMDKKGRILGWLNELAFAPVDYNPQADTDEWSSDRGVGALYFSQQAVKRLLSAAGISLPNKWVCRNGSRKFRRSWPEVTRARRRFTKPSACISVTPSRITRTFMI